MNNKLRLAALEAAATAGLEAARRAATVRAGERSSAEREAAIVAGLQQMTAALKELNEEYAASVKEGLAALRAQQAQADVVGERLREAVSELTAAVKLALLSTHVRAQLDPRQLQAMERLIGMTAEEKALVLTYQQHGGRVALARLTNIDFNLN